VSVYLRATTTAPGSPRPDGSPPAAASPWLRAVRWRLRERLHNPTLRTLAIADITLLPPGDAYWSPGARRTAVVALEQSPSSNACLAPRELNWSAR
jgi:hypothetical protein